MDSSVVSQPGNAPPGSSGLNPEGDSGRAIAWNTNTTNPYMDKGVGVYEADLGKYCAGNGASPSVQERVRGVYQPLPQRQPSAAMMMMNHGGNTPNQSIQGDQSEINPRMGQGGTPVHSMQQRMAQGSSGTFHNQKAVGTQATPYQQFAGMNPAAFGQMVQGQNSVHAPGQKYRQPTAAEMGQTPRAQKVANGVPTQYQHPSAAQGQNGMMRGSVSAAMMGPVPPGRNVTIPSELFNQLATGRFFRGGGVDVMPAQYQRHNAQMQQAQMMRGSAQHLQPTFARMQAQQAQNPMMPGHIQNQPPTAEMLQMLRRQYSTMHALPQRQQSGAAILQTPQGQNTTAQAHAQYQQALATMRQTPQGQNAMRQARSQHQQTAAQYHMPQNQNMTADEAQMLQLQQAEAHMLKKQEAMARSGRQQQSLHSGMASNPSPHDMQAGTPATPYLYHSQQHSSMVRGSGGTDEQPTPVNYQSNNSAFGRPQQVPASAYGGLIQYIVQRRGSNGMVFDQQSINQQNESFQASQDMYLRQIQSQRPREQINGYVLRNNDPSMTINSNMIPQMAMETVSQSAAIGRGENAVNLRQDSSEKFQHSNARSSKVSNPDVTNDQLNRHKGKTQEEVSIVQENAHSNLAYPSSQSRSDISTNEAPSSVTTRSDAQVSRKRGYDSTDTSLAPNLHDSQKDPLSPLRENSNNIDPLLRGEPFNLHLPDEKRRKSNPANPQPGPKKDATSKNLSSQTINASSTSTRTSPYGKIIPNAAVSMHPYIPGPHSASRPQDDNAIATRRVSRILGPQEIASSPVQPQQSDGPSTEDLSKPLDIFHNGEVAKVVAGGQETLPLNTVSKPGRQSLGDSENTLHDHSVNGDQCSDGGAAHFIDTSLTAAPVSQDQHLEAELGRQLTTFLATPTADGGSTLSDLAQNIAGPQWPGMVRTITFENGEYYRFTDVDLDHVQLMDQTGYQSNAEDLTDEVSEEWANGQSPMKFDDWIAFHNFEDYEGLGNIIGW